MQTFDQVVVEIAKERLRQDKKWGVQNHSNAMWLSILVEEVGEVSKEIADNWERKFYFDNTKDIEDRIKYHENLKKELIQVAAVCVAWLENYPH